MTSTSVATGRQLTSAQTIHRGDVHRAAIAEVFLTDHEPTSDGMRAAAQLPRNHSYFSDHRGAVTSYDPLLLIEVFRQASILYAHTSCEASSDQKFIFNSAEFTILDPAGLRVGGRPGHCEIAVTVADRVLRQGTVTGVTLDFLAIIDGVETASERMVLQWMPPKVWERIRGRARADLGLTDPPQLGEAERYFRLRPFSVGRTNPRNSILANPIECQSGLEASVIIDTEHPSLFDHELDHVPGMLLFEASRQIAMAASNHELARDTSRMLLTGLSMNFTAFGELELPTSARAHVLSSDDGGAQKVGVELTQNGAAIAHGFIELSPHRPDVRNLVL
ncbi:MAG: ScbA/BarX family gamma-butyrolactone biosynthesis protein [Nocardioides sp.]|uniref:ScbA/BarX family gamma-butyrolactone biosynthesis protein n=1 Tax=Nocardioides sp. TaxID=35761 RepID=UPI003D6AE976